MANLKVAPKYVDIGVHNTPIMVDANDYPVSLNKIDRALIVSGFGLTERSLILLSLKKSLSIVTVQ